MKIKGPGRFYHISWSGIIGPKTIWSGALSGLMLDLGLLKIIWGEFFLFLAPAGDFNLAGPYSNPFPNPAGQS